MRKSRIITALILIVLSVGFRYLLVGYSFSSYLLLAAAACVIFFELLHKYEDKDICKTVRKISICLVLLLLAAFTVTEVMIISASFGTNSENADYIVVLGAGVNGTEPSLSLRNRLDAAAKYLNDNPDALCIASGGQGAGEDISEAECMARFLISKGISAARIIKEDKSTTTEENVKFSLDIIKLLGKEDPKIAVISSEYHLFRAKMMFKHAGVDAGTIPGKTKILPLKINYFLREAPASWVFMLFK